jgi:hypothetical protein
MPYKSKAQESFFHSPKAAAAGISPERVEEYDEESAGMNLPDKAPKSNGIRKALPDHLKKRIALRRALKK